MGVSPATSTPTSIYSQRFWGFISPGRNPGLCGLPCSPVIPPSLFTCKCGITWSTSCHLAMCISALAAQLCPPTRLNECFFFNPLVVRIIYILIWGQFWIFFVFKFVAILLLVARGGKVLSTCASILAGSLNQSLLTSLVHMYKQIFKNF